MDHNVFGSNAINILFIGKFELVSSRPPNIVPHKITTFAFTATTAGNAKRAVEAEYDSEKSDGKRWLPNTYFRGFPSCDLTARKSYPPG